MNRKVLTVILMSYALAGCTGMNSLSGDVYSAQEAKHIKNVSYGTIVSVRPIQIQGGDENNVVGAIGGAVLGGVLGNTIGGGSGKTVATAGGALLGGLAGQNVQNYVNKSHGVELEIRKANGETIIVVQKDDPSKFAVGQHVVIASDGKDVTVSPR